MNEKKFDPAKLAKLNDPKRLESMPPDLLWERLGLKEPEVIVDIGAGTGFFTVRFAKKMIQGKAYACDISDVMLEWMREHLPEEMRETVIPVKMSEASVPLPDGIADLVYMINLHHELDDPSAIIGECRRLLKAGGTLMIADWKKEETPEGPPLEIRVEAETIQRQMREEGFRDITEHPVLQYHNFVTGRKL